MQLKNKQLEGFLSLASSHEMISSQNLLISADGVEVTLPTSLPGDSFSVIRSGEWIGTTTYTAPTGFTVDGEASIEVSDKTSDLKFVLVGMDWQSFQTTVQPLVTPGSLLAANICVGSPILIPKGNTKDTRTVGTGGDYATFALALADATVVDGTILRAVSDVVDTSTVNVNRAVVIDLAGFTHSNATSVSMFNITAPLAVVKGGTLHHTKATNTSVENVITINTATGVAFVVGNTIKVQELGVVVQGGAMITGNKFAYAGASQTNSHRFIPIFKITAETKIDNNEFTCSTIPATTRYTNFVFMGAIAGSTWTAPLWVTRNRQTGGSLRQFVFNEALMPDAGSQLIVAANSFNDFNGGIGLISPALYNGLDKIVIADNHQGSDATGNFKGVFFVDGTGTLNDTTEFIYSGNTTAAGVLRADYVSLASDTTNIVAVKNTVTPPAVSATEQPLDVALSDTGDLLQELKGKRTYIVDQDGNSLEGFGTEDQPFKLPEAELPNDGEPTGFESLSSTLSIGTLTGYDPAYEFDSTDTTFTITPTGSQVVWVQGKKFVKTDPESVTVADDGLTFIYYNTDGVLSTKATHFDFKAEAPVSYVYRYDGKVLFMGDERHGITMDGATHEYLHRTVGAAYASGFGVNGFVTDGDGDAEADATINLAPGEFYDEDLLIHIQHGLTGARFTQPLETPAQLPVFFHTDDGWDAVQATNIPAVLGTNRLAFNLKTGETWSVEDVQNNHFGVMYVIATNNLLAPVMAVMGQASYGSKGAAEASLYSDFDLDGFPFFEFRPLYKLIYQVKNSFTNSVKAALRGVMDQRTIASSGVGTSAAQVNDHGSLTGLLDDDHPQYLTEERANLRYLLNTTSTAAPSLTDPTVNTAFKNQMVTVGDDIYFVDATGKAVLMDKPLATSSIEPVVYQGSAFTSAQADDAANVTDALQLSDGTRISTGRLSYPGHPYTVGMWYYLSQATAGGVTAVQPSSGLVQQLFFVEDANTLLVNVEQAAIAPGTGATPTGAAGGALTGTYPNPGLSAAAVVAAIPNTAKTVRGLVNLTDLQQMGDGRKVFDAGVHVGNGNPAFAGRATVTAIGPNAGRNNTGSNQTATGNVAGQNNTGSNQTATGNVAGRNNTGSSQTATGVSAGQNNTGVNQTATGAYAGQNNTGVNQTATGVFAGQNNTRSSQTATGHAAGRNNTGSSQTATGVSAGQNNTGENNSFYGAESGAQTGTLLGTVTMTPSSSTAGTVSPALPASVVGKSLPVNISGFDWCVLTFTSTTAYTMVGGPASGSLAATVYQGLAFNNVTVLGYASEPTASNQVMLGNGAVTEVRTAGTYFGAGFTTVSDVTLKEHIKPIDPAKALQFRNGLQWRHYEVFAETQSEVKVEKTFDRETVTNEDGTTETRTVAVTVSEPTGAYKVTRVSQGTKYGLIAQDVQALAETVGAFADVVIQIGEYFTLDAQGYPVKDAQGKPIVNKRFGLDYDAINFIILAAEQYDSSVSRRQGEHAVSQQDATGAIKEGVSSYLLSDGNSTSPLTLPANAPYVGFDLMIINGATLNTTINTTNTDMAANFTLSTGKAKVFKWGGSTAKWVALN